MHFADMFLSMILRLIVAATFVQILECYEAESVRSLEAGGGASFQTRSLFDPAVKLRKKTKSTNPMLGQHKAFLNDFNNIMFFGSTAKAGKGNKNSGWPMKTVKFNHPIQSPVDLITSKAVTMALPTLEIIETDLQNVQAKFYNSGHTVYIYINEDAILRPYLVGGPLKQKFIFEQMHFHWGSEDIWGSEHFIDGESFAVEIHAVHYNSKYGSYEVAATQPDGLVVLTVFAEAVNTSNPLLEPLHRLIPNITKEKTSVMLDSTDALRWATSALSTNPNYYTYPGSLTTKPYTENVIFILLPEPITLSHTQLGAFRELHSDADHCIVDNKRKLQPLHNRPIVRSFSLQ